MGFDKVVNEKKYEIRFPKGTDKAIVDKLAQVCRHVAVEEYPGYAEVLKVYFAQPFYRDAEQMNREDAEEVKELRGAFETALN